METKKIRKTKEIRQPENPGFRFTLGIGIFAASFFMLPTGMVLKGFVEPNVTKAVVLTAFWLAAPLMKVIAIAILGKPSYLWIRYKMHLYRTRAIPHKVSRTRYNTGLFLFILPFIPNYILAYAPNLFPNEYLIRSGIHFFFDLVFISSLFVLGGNFWDKLRALFIYTANAEFEQGPEEV